MGAATVEAIWVTDEGSRPMRRVDRADAVAGCGIAGDRYCGRTGYWTGTDECQITFIAAEALEEVTAEGIDVSAGQHRRNVVTRGLDISALQGRRWRIGEAVFAYERRRPPCRHVQLLSQDGMTRALTRGRGGICATVEVPGAIAPGDAVEVLEG